MTVLVTILLTLGIQFLLFMAWWTYPRSVKSETLVHHHEWTDWSGWVEEMPYSTVRRWSRQRVCHECGKSERREVGRHRCDVGTGKPCPHRAQYAALMEDKTTRLERDLGMGPQGID